MCATHTLCEAVAILGCGTLCLCSLCYSIYGMYIQYNTLLANSQQVWCDCYNRIVRVFVLLQMYQWYCALCVWYNIPKKYHTWYIIIMQHTHNNNKYYYNVHI